MPFFSSSHPAVSSICMLLIWSLYKQQHLYLFNSHLLLQKLIMIANKKVDGEFPICGQRRQIHENLIKK